MQARRDRREERVGGLDLAVSPYGLAHYVPGERGWIKTRNRAYLRYEMEREGALAPRDTRLTADVDCSSLTLGSAVFVVGDGITLDLNGHTIHGPSDPASVSTFGVVVRGAGVTVKGAR